MGFLLEIYQKSLKKYSDKLLQLLQGTVIYLALSFLSAGFVKQLTCGVFACHPAISRIPVYSHP